MLRCFGDGDPLYEDYHDLEWGRQVSGEAALFERIALEGFQAGLSWLVILRKREAFREVFVGFDPEAVAGFRPEDVDRLVRDPRIVRNRAKIEATVAGARAMLAMHDAGDSLTDLFARHAPVDRREPPISWDDVPAVTEESTALATELKRLGFRFIGPTTAYAAMQAIGVVNDHLAACPARAGGRRTAAPAASTGSPRS